MRALLINPVFPTFFWTMPQLCRIQGCKSSTAPLGLITVAAMLPADWQLRLVDLNTRAIASADWDWADVVLISAMAVQKAEPPGTYSRGQGSGQNRGRGRPLPLGHARRGDGRGL